MNMKQRHSWSLRSLWPRRHPPFFAILFLVVLYLPLLKSIVSPAETYSLRDQGKNLSASGGGSPKSDFLSRWQSRVNEHFAGRDILIRWNNLLQVKLLKVSPLKTVTLGRNGWLFLDGSNMEMNYFRAAPPFSEDELSRWRRVLLQRHIWLARQGIRFFYIIAPNKSTIYPEKVPARIHRAATRLDQLLDYLQRRPLPAGFHFIDLRKTLRAAKSQYPVFDKFDSHLNCFGALLAANKIVRVLSRFYPLHPSELKDFSVSMAPRTSYKGDMAAMLTLPDVLFDPQVVKVTSRSPARAIVSEPARWINKYLEREVTVCPGAELPEALMFRDSFGYALAEYLSEHFRKLTYIRDMGLGFHPRFVFEVRPRIVIQEMGERFLQIVPPANPPELATIGIEHQMDIGNQKDRHANARSSARKSPQPEVFDKKQPR